MTVSTQSQQTNKNNLVRSNQTPVSMVTKTKLQWYNIV